MNTSVYILVTFIVTLFLGIPLYFVLGLTCFVYFFANNVEMFMVLQRVFVGLNSFVVLAVPA